MPVKLLNRTTVFLVMFMLSLSILTAQADTDSATGHEVFSEKEMLLAVLNLDEDVDESEIIQILDIPIKRIFATALIRYRKISLATPKLLDIVNDKKATIPEKLTAAKALCDFGNTEWTQSIKILLQDKEHVAYIPLKLDVAGLLARVGDYSHFEVIANNINNSKYWVRYAAIKALGNFRHETNAITDLAADLLTSVAVSDSVPWLREHAIEKLEELAVCKPTIVSQVINASEANIDSADKNLRITSRAKLNRYSQQ